MTVDTLRRINFLANMIAINLSLTSVGLNSTLHPIEELGGGGLNLMVCQLVD